MLQLQQVCISLPQGRLPSGSPLELQLDIHAPLELNSEFLGVTAAMFHQQLVPRQQVPLQQTSVSIMEYGISSWFWVVVHVVPGQTRSNHHNHPQALA